MPKFIIEYDSSRKNTNNEFLPLKQFVPGVISLKNIYQPYTLYIGELNKSYLNTIDIFKSNTEIYKKILSTLPKTTEIVNTIRIIPKAPSNSPTISSRVRNPPIRFNNITGRLTPYVFTNINPDFVPPPITTTYLKQVRQKALEMSLSRIDTSNLPFRVPPVNPPRFPPIMRF